MYGKLFAQMYDGSLYGKWQALVTFQQLIVLADVDGVVDMTPQALAARTSIPIEIILQGLSDLEQPDPDSRTPAEEGRRIVRLSEDRTWGWRLTNYAHYRQIRSAEERREYMREYQQKRREAKEKTVNNVNQPSTPVNTRKQNQPIAVSRSRKQKQKNTPPTPPESAPDGASGCAVVVEVGTVNGNGPGHAVVLRGRDAVLERGRHALAEVLALSQQQANTEQLRHQMVAFGFAYWQARHDHPNALQDPKRERLLWVRLKENQNDISELLYAADGARKDRNLMGENERGRKYDGIETIYRDRAQVERLAALAGYRPGMVHPQLAAGQGSH